MPKIQVLDKQVAELIAAGEVVDRPSSVIKELVENAVDAGATIITVEIRRGGVTFMRVTDNGCGIAPEDVPTAFLRHATSKVVGEDDLNSIATLGFRGEALASISAVAHVELLTRTPGAVAGVRYTCGGAEEPTLEDAGCPEGTTILVRDLFYNTPARMKFLKKDSTEGNSVAGILDKLALSHPEISFRFLRDGKEQLHTPGDGKLSSTIYAVYGREFSSTLIPVHYELGHVKVEGFISAPTSSRPNRSMQNFFINGRYIRSRTAMAALEEAYKGSIMVGKFPACVLHLHLSFGAGGCERPPRQAGGALCQRAPHFRRGVPRGKVGPPRRGQAQSHGAEAAACQPLRPCAGAQGAAAHGDAPASAKAPDTASARCRPTWQAAPEGERPSSPGALVPPAGQRSPSPGAPGFFQLSGECPGQRAPAGACGARSRASACRGKAPGVPANGPRPRTAAPARGRSSPLWTTPQRPASKEFHSPGDWGGLWHLPSGGVQRRRADVHLTSTPPTSACSTSA